MKLVDGTIARIDRTQQRHKGLGFPYAVMKKFGDDQAGYLAALIAYYGFFSLFPLLLVFVSILGIVLKGDPSLQHRVVSSALANFPVIGPQISQNIHGLTGSGVVLALGIIGTLWGGLGVTMAAQYAMNTVWAVPFRDRPNFLFSRLRGLGLLAVMGTLTVVSSALSGIAGGGSAWYFRVGGVVISVAVNLALFLFAFRVLTTEKVGWRDVLPGAVIAAVVWTILQIVGGYYVTHQLKTASNVYGTFAIVIGLLVWIYLGAQLTLYCAEINVVKKRRLWPRSLQPDKVPTQADKDVLAAQAKASERPPAQEVQVRFDEGTDRASEDEARTA
jgi:YihY family inner membrane protein